MSSFTRLWNAHPKVTVEPPVLDRKVYENQCAINLSMALSRVGVSLNLRAGSDFQKAKAVWFWALP